MVYIFWLGYFHELDIDTCFIKIRYDGFVFQVMFIAIILCAVMFVMSCVENIFKNRWNTIKTQKENVVRKIGNNIIIIIIEVFVALVILGIINIPISMTLCAWNKVECTLKNMILMIMLLCLLESAFLISTQINNIGTYKEKLNAENRLFVNIFITIFFVCIVCAGTYYSGSQSILSQNQAKLVEEDKYMITYSDGDRYILHGVVVAEETLTIKRSEQKVINNLDVICKSKTFKEIIVSD